MNPADTIWSLPKTLLTREGDIDRISHTSPVISENPISMPITGDENIGMRTFSTTAFR
jgi:hypothetical protein